MIIVLANTGREYAEFAAESAANCVWMKPGLSLPSAAREATELKWMRLPTASGFDAVPDGLSDVTPEQAQLYLS